ncbi:MAG: hypothetical protein IJG65_03870 [Synergistaceae bacterium]|nr:hypothetical protein [Synergistaceae bacterium]
MIDILEELMEEIFSGNENPAAADWLGFDYCDDATDRAVFRQLKSSTGQCWADAQAKLGELRAMKSVCRTPEP